MRSDVCNSSPLPSFVNTHYAALSLEYCTEFIWEHRVYCTVHKSNFVFTLIVIWLALFEYAFPACQSLLSFPPCLLSSPLLVPSFFLLDRFPPFLFSLQFHEIRVIPRRKGANVAKGRAWSIGAGIKRRDGS